MTLSLGVSSRGYSNGHPAATIIPSLFALAFGPALLRSIQRFTKRLEISWLAPGSSVVPVLAVNKKRKSDTRLVNVEVWPESDKITTGQVVVRLFQSEPVNEKVQPRTVRTGLYVGETLISNQIELTFDQASTDKRDRYQSAHMLLSKDANDYNNRAVEFRLEERISNTNQWRVYAKAMYTLKRSFASDFDF